MIASAVIASYHIEVYMFFMTLFIYGLKKLPQFGPWKFQTVLFSILL